MVAQSHWSHAEWKHDDEKRLHVTLGLSVLLHAVLLLAWKLPPQVWRAADHAVLTVVLRGAAPLAPSSSPAVEQLHDVAVLVQKHAAPAAFSVPPRELAKPAVAPPAVRPQPAPAVSQARVSTQATQGAPLNRNSSVVGVTVTLVIGADGRIRQMFWDQLPALTDEQFRRVEAAMREKTYAAGRTLNEVVDVRALLKLPQPRPQESPESAVRPAGE
ncbi:MAG: hypothetical protein NTW45_06805 [Rhodocyclales bacterium]|nr:hypothetical protein [Rhodocyclales bacterium]